MQRQRKRKGNKRKKAATRPRGGEFSAVPRGSSRALMLSPSRKQWITFRTRQVVTNVGNTGASTTFQLYTPSSLSPVPIGLAANWSNTPPSTVSLYQNARQLAVRAQAKFSNTEAFPVRVAIVLCATTPAANALSSQALQQPYLTQITNAFAEREIGPLTGNGICSLSTTASNSRNLGVRHLKGNSDPFTNYWDVTTDAIVLATNGIAAVVMGLCSTAFTAAGVVVDLECEMLYEFFSPNTQRTT